MAGAPLLHYKLVEICTGTAILKTLRPCIYTNMSISLRQRVKGAVAYCRAKGLTRFCQCCVKCAPVLHSCSGISNPWEAEQV